MDNKAKLIDKIIEDIPAEVAYRYSSGLRDLPKTEKSYVNYYDSPESLEIRPYAKYVSYTFNTITDNGGPGAYTERINERYEWKMDLCNLSVEELQKAYDDLTSPMAQLYAPFKDKRFTDFADLFIGDK